MKHIFIYLLLLNTLLFAINDQNNTRQQRIDNQIQKEIEKEKRYAIEQQFYNQHNYDFKGSEINQESLDSVPEIEVDDFDMDSVYD